MSSSEERRRDAFERLERAREELRFEIEKRRVWRLEEENKVMSRILLVATRLLEVWVKANVK